MPRLHACVAGLVALLLLMTTAVGANPARELLFDVQPVTLDGRTLVPLRPIFEWLGARVTYENGHIRAWRSEEATVPQVELWVGSTEARIAEAGYTLDVAPQLIKRRAFVPLRFVAESFGVWVDPMGQEMLLRLPQENIEALMAIPPHPQTLQGKMWRVIETWYDVLPTEEEAPPASGPPAPPADADAAAVAPLEPGVCDDLCHWGLFSDERKQEIIDEVGEDAPTIVEAHWGGRGPVRGIRILQYRLDSGGVTGWALVIVGYPDVDTEVERFDFVREPDGWKVRDVVPGVEAPAEPSTEENQE